ncbi:MAG: Glycosyltransferase involved in cell wall biogenesis [Candidatus Nomurabacteria bacterium GW2011_GWF2_35_12]|uniref:Glycosyltransferase involved in cell wall biogenesis n=3 Tax=Candidatus Nomuraibacteriota TaxID=1752729 RepID=A0A0G0DV10_9BACT|nr:MAG: Glycosyltransferase involved in cell wall biogenesis [Candidatus Nomurabacteria bacterium GW2011_GWF2_35_12]KKP72937.1 MAG: Glycosyltransferase involved in cell wall biogenesis [Candidatus Nomurabacteria bacterium GW2011_GWB1_35_20]KKP75557.1 MAG: Glycosyltransferase involved in cell wall biogenesis [Parcubacteria group bacterium GW2011_GWC1_35_21]KKP78631.1 MAG: Glycosyltransferase involved in cell wall biogenesis [Candidatus Nomurabacteria bacterium GW2011_GWC2_35_35]KKP85064.1 MAG: G
MVSFSGVVFYVLTFLSVYVQVFFLITFLENRKKIIIRNEPVKLAKYPKVTIIVPCWDEEKTIYKTVRSLLNLNYPKDKIEIFLIDDGSTDGTWNIIRKFAKPARPNGRSGGYPNIRIFHKENGGKYTALNLGLKYVQTNFLGCLDADSVADPESLVRVISYFEKDPNIMAVAPSIIAFKSKNIIQNAQKAEYDMSVYIKKMLGFLGAIHVTPGPLTIFRRKVFDDLGPYRHAHNTEDMEIAYRMQKNHYRIEQCNDAYVYTNTPLTIRKLYRQRLRWIYGFINNTIDYRKILFRKNYGNFSLFTIPSSIISIFAVGFLFGKMIYSLGSFLFSKIIQFQAIGLHLPNKVDYLDPFFINTQTLFFIVVILYFLIMFSIILGRKMTEGKWGFSFDMIYFLLIFSAIGPFWLLKAVYNTVLSRKPGWR